jgi:hypothetical protein
VPGYGVAPTGSFTWAFTTAATFLLPGESQVTYSCCRRNPGSNLMFMVRCRAYCG